MNEEKSIRNRLIRYGVSAVVATALLFTVLIVNRYWSQDDAQSKLRILCDAFCVPGLLLMLSTGLVFCRNAGAFNGLFYGLRTAKEILLPFLPYEHMNFRQYVEKRSEKKIKGYSFLLITGAAFLTVGLILLVIFHIRYS